MTFPRFTAEEKLGALWKYRREEGLFNALRRLCYTPAHSDGPVREIPD
jgi:hypothetical protein